MIKEIIFIIILFLIFISCEQKIQNPLESQISEMKNVVLDTIPKEKCRIYKKDTIIDDYHFEIEFISENDDYEGKTKFTILKKDTDELVQIIYSDRFVFYDNLEIWYDEDWNFDGYKDLVFCNGMSGRGVIFTFDYYFYNPNNQTFVLNKYLTEMNNQARLDLDKENQRIIMYEKSGCCWYKNSVYVVEGNNFVEKESLEGEFIPTKETEIDSMPLKGKWQTVIKKLENGKWQKQVYPNLSEVISLKEIR